MKNSAMKTNSNNKIRIKKKSIKKYELLAPAGDFSMLSAAVHAGADAVYFGLKEFSMRQGAGNFLLKDLDEIGKICKPKKVKKYLTLNTIIYEDEIPKIEKIIKQIKNKIDAVICWDLSVIQLCKKHKINFFISTQASVSNSSSAEFFKKLGSKRIVLARELNLNQIKEIIKKTKLEVECFCHGAMCVAVSGRCFTSQFLFNKSANRGECIHPCRRSYIVKDKQEGYELELENDKVMSAKDLCTLPFIEKMKSAGIKSFKIEGRNRDARYVDVVVRAYRQALDKQLSKNQISKLVEELKQVYNKEFSSGFYLGMPNSSDFARIEHSSAKKEKKFVGKVSHYFSKIGVAAIKVSSKIKLGDEICIIGRTTGIINSKVERIEAHNKPIKEANKGDEIGIKLPLVRKNDEVYVINKRK